MTADGVKRERGNGEDSVYFQLAANPGRGSPTFNNKQTSSFSRYYHMDNISIEFMFRILLCWSLGGLVIVIVIDRATGGLPR